MRAERKAGVVVGAVRAGAHAVRKPKVVDSAPARSSAPLRYIVTLSVLIATLAFVALDTFAVHRAELAGFFSKPISKVRIENQWQRVSESDVTGILQQYIGAGFFDFDINGASRDLEALPWVASVDLRRLWPDTLSLHLREEVPIAKWGAVELLNQYGELFSPTDTDDFAGLADIVRNPIYSTGVGLLLYGLKQFQEQGGIITKGEPRVTLVSRVKSWFQGDN